MSLILEQLCLLKKKLTSVAHTKQLGTTPKHGKLGNYKKMESLMKKKSCVTKLLTAPPTACESCVVGAIRSFLLILKRKVSLN